MQRKKRISVFVSYAWDSEIHKQNVLNFVGFLRDNGLDATFDRAVSQNETATNFFRMMHKGIQHSDKIIIVLSEGYRKKADSFTGGAGYEYELILTDIKNNPKKYILVSFEGVGDSTIPFSFQGREIVDLSMESNNNTLFSKLTDTPIIELPDVSPELPVVTTTPIGEFKIVNATQLKILTPKLTQGSSATQAGIIDYLRFKVNMVVENTSKQTIPGLGFSIEFPKSLMSRRERYPANGEFAEISGDIRRRIYPEQHVVLQEFEIETNGHNVHATIGSKISVTIYVDSGPIAEEFSLFDDVKIRPGTLYGKGALVFGPDLFRR